MTEQQLPAVQASPALQLKGAEKVAALLVTIGTQAAARVLSRLPVDAVEQVAAALMDMPLVKAPVRDQVLEETYTALFEQMSDSQGGQQYTLELFIEAFGEAKGMVLLDKVHAARVKPPFDFLLQTEPMQVAQLLTGENPQTIAIVLAHLEPRAAAKILTLLETDMQVEVSRRIALTEQTTPEAVALVEEGIQRRMSTVVQESTQVGGVKPLAQVLNQVDRTTERAILGTLTEMDPDLAADVRKNMFVFEDITLLDDKGMQRLIREIDTKDLSLALRNVAEDLKSKFFKNMSQRAAEMLREEMAIAGQVRMKNVEEAQGRIVEVVKRLEDSDEIMINRGGGDDGFV